jgi:hypothetical protein
MSGRGPDPGLAGRLVPEAGLVDVQASAWSRTTSRPDEATVLVYLWTSLLQRLDRVEVEETDEHVVLTVFLGVRPAEGPVRSVQIAQERSVTVDLGAPLGARRVLDGAAR